MQIPNNIVELFSQIDETEHKFNKYHAYRAVEQLFEGHEQARVRAITYLNKIGVYSDHAFYLSESEDIVDDLIQVHKIAKESHIPFETLKHEYITHLHKYGNKNDALEHIGKYVKKHLYLKESKEDFIQKLNSIDDSTIDKLASKIKSITDIMKHYKPEEFSYHINESTKEEVVWNHVRKILKKASKRVKLKKKSKPKAIIHKAKAVAKHLLVAHLFGHHEEHVDHSIEHAIIKSSAYKKLVSRLSPKIAKIEEEAVHEHHEIHEDIEPLTEPVSTLPEPSSPHRYLSTSDKKQNIIASNNGKSKKESNPAGVISYLVSDNT